MKPTKPLTNKQYGYMKYPRTVREMIMKAVNDEAEVNVTETERPLLPDTNAKPKVKWTLTNCVAFGWHVIYSNRP